MSRHLSFLFRSIFLAVVLILLPTVVQAQQFKANVTGTVTDAQGGLMPGVTVTVVNTDTNVSAASVTDTSASTP